MLNPTLRVAVNTMRARLTVLGFNLAIITFQIGNTRGLGGGIQLDGFATTVHLSAGVVLLTGVALTIAAMVAFIASTALDREGTCDPRTLLAGDLLMYLALAQTISGFFAPYERLLAAVSLSTVAGQQALSSIRVGLLVAGSMTWILATYVGPVVALIRAPHDRVTKVLHAVAYLGVLLCISRLWWAAQTIEGRLLDTSGALFAWLNAFTAPLWW